MRYGREVLKGAERCVRRYGGEVRKGAERRCVSEVWRGGT